MPMTLSSRLRAVIGEDTHFTGIGIFADLRSAEMTYEQGMLPRCSAIDAEVDRAIERLHVPRSCVVALVNDGGVRWRLERVRFRRGEGADAAPRTIEPWSAVVFSARNVAARPGAGCAGELWYRGHDRALLTVSFDVPYAGSALAEVTAGGPPPARVHRFTSRAAASGTVVFRLRVPLRSGCTDPFF
jgi:hypothetical protein